MKQLGGFFHTHSRGQALAPATALSPNGNNTPPIVIPEFSAWLTLVLEQCRAENIRNLPRQRAPTPLFPERRPREACSMPISGCHDLPLATFNLPSRNRPQTNAKESPKPKTSSPAPPQGGVPSTLWRHACLTTPVVKPSPPQSPSEQTATTPPHKTKKPSCRHSVAACVSDHSRGQALPPANPLRTNGNNTQTIVIPESPPQGGASHRSCGCAVAKRLHGREAGSPPSASARPASRSPAAGSGRRMTSPRFAGRGG